MSKLQSSSSSSKPSNEELQYREAITHIISKFNKSRLTRFANNHKLTAEQIHTHNSLPIWFLMKQFKAENHLKTRSFKNLSDEQKQLWIQYYDSHKQLQLLSDEEHTKFHASNIFDSKNGKWINNIIEEKPIQETLLKQHPNTPVNSKQESSDEASVKQPTFELPTPENTIKSVSRCSKPKLSQHSTINKKNNTETSEQESSVNTSPPKESQSKNKTSLSKSQEIIPSKTAILKPNTSKTNSSKTNKSQNALSTGKSQEKQHNSIAPHENVKIKIVRPKTKSSLKKGSSGNISSDEITDFE